ncbi:MAG: N-acetyltransferase [Saprospiraceae bacterium]|nr:N-acetyltransferase [Saprospiraceae bacterium]
MEIRPEHIGDFSELSELIKSAFGTSEEAFLVEELRNSTAFITELSLVALVSGKIVGHILFTPVDLQAGETDTLGFLALAPLSVLPELQNRGIGSQLVKHGLNQAEQLGHSAVFVLGHPAYYPRFGFVPASDFQIMSPFPVPDESFLARELVPGSLSNVTGTIEYLPPFYKME